MLVLSRRTRDSIMIGHDVVVTVLSIGRDQVRLGIVAPSDVEVHREEVYRSIQEANRAAAASQGDPAQLAQVVPLEPQVVVVEPGVEPVDQLSEPVAQDVEPAQGRSGAKEAQGSPAGANESQAGADGREVVAPIGATPADESSGR